MASCEDYHHVVQNNFFHIIKAIANSGAPTIEMIASDLLSHDTIREADEEAVLNPGGLSPTQIVARLVAPVLNKIEDVPETYKDLLEVFRHNGLEFIAAKLEDEVNRGMIGSARCTKSFPS